MRAVSLLRGELAPPPRTLVDIFRATDAAGPGRAGHRQRRRRADLRGVRRGGGRGRRRARRHRHRTRRQGRRPAPARAPPTSTSRSWRSCSPARPTSRSTPTTPTSAPAWSSTRPTSRPSSAPTWPWSPAAHGPRATARTRPPTTTPGSSSPPARPARPRVSRSRHRNAAAFVDAESRLFLQDVPLGPGDRVMAGLSVAFDASCEEMWLAWRYGGCLVPAPRALVRSGIDVGPWLSPTRSRSCRPCRPWSSLWPDEALDEGPPADPGRRGRARPSSRPGWCATGREVWNTYGPTEATVVACGARLTGEGPVRIGLPLDGWDLAVVDADGEPVPRRGHRRADHRRGRAGPLPRPGRRTPRSTPPMPTLGWERAYRSGDLVVHDPEGLLFGGRADDQVKLGGRRIELGEIDSALLALPGVHAAAAAVRRTATGNQLLVGYVVTDDGVRPASRSMARLRQELPGRPGAAARRGRRRPDPDLRQGRPRRAPLAVARAEATATADDLRRDGRLDRRSSGATCWARPPPASTDDFFDHGGGSLTAAQMVSLLRAPLPRGRRRRHLRPPHRRRPGRVPRRAGPGRRRRPRPVGAADAAQDPGQVRSSRRRSCGWPRPPVAGLVAARVAAGRPSARPRRAAHRLLVVAGSWPCWSFAHPARPDAARRRRRPPAAARRRPGRPPARRPGAPAAVGRRARWSTSSARSTSPGRRT